MIKFSRVLTATTVVMVLGAVLGAAAPASASPTSDRLGSGTALGPGDWITSPNGAYQLVMRADGNLVEYAGEFAMWQTSTRVAGSSLTNQADGDLTVTSPDGTVLWASGTTGQGPADLLVRDDGVLVEQSSTGTIWTANPAGGPSASALGALSFAKQQLGKPYVFGGSGPDAYDTSGLIMASYISVGISLPHYSSMQCRMGQPVARSGLRLGDLVCYEYGYYVAIYLGLDQVIYAASGSTYITTARIDNLGKATGFRRIA
jgi:cell wall-associated NlpC family hydrolase